MLQLIGDAYCKIRCEGAKFTDAAKDQLMAVEQDTDSAAYLDSLLSAGLEDDADTDSDEDS